MDWKVFCLYLYVEEIIVDVRFIANVKNNDERSHSFAFDD